MAAGRRRLAFDGFVAALDALAVHRGDLDLLDVAASVAAAGGPVLHATSPEPTRLHDDVSGYTGMYAARSSGCGSAEGEEKITLQVGSATTASTNWRVPCCGLTLTFVLLAVHGRPV